MHTRRLANQAQCLRLASILMSEITANSVALSFIIRCTCHLFESVFQRVLTIIRLLFYLRRMIDFQDIIMTWVYICVCIKF